MAFQHRLRSRMAKRSAAEIRRSLTDGQVEPLDERRVELRGVLGFKERLLELPSGTDDLSSFNLDDAVVPPRLYHLPVHTDDSKHLADDSRVELVPVGDDQWGVARQHSTRSMSQECSGVSVTAAADDRRQPESRPNVERGKDPDGMVLVSENGANFISLELRHLEASDFSVAEPTTRLGGLLEPAVDGVPCESFHSGDGRLAETLDAESGDFVEGRAPVLETVIGGPSGGAESPAAGRASVTTSSTVSRLGEPVSDDRGRLGAGVVRAARSFHVLPSGQ